MGVGDALVRIYLSWEERYYHFMDYLDERVHVPVYTYYVDPLETRGIPSFPVTLLLFFILLAALVWFLTPPAVVDFRVTVLDQGGDRVPAAYVEARDAAGQTLQYTNTSENGLATLTGLPRQVLTLRVEKLGYAVAEREVDAAREASARVTLVTLPSVTPTPFPTPIVVSTPIPTPFPTTVAVSTPRPTIEPSARPQMGKLTVGVKDKETGKALAFARVKVFNSLTDALLAEEDAINGVVEFTDLSVGSQIYLTAQAEGYALYEGKARAFSVKPVTAQVVQLEALKPENLVTTRVRTVEADVGSGANATNVTGPLLASHIWILTLEQLVLNETDSPSEVSFTLLRDRQLQAYAYKAGYLSARKYFLSGQDVTLGLRRVNATNAAVLKVNVRDLDDRKVTNASVSLYTSFLEFLFPPKLTKNGEVSFVDLPRGERVVVRATLNETFADAEVDLDAPTKSVDLVLEPIREELSAQAVQAGTNDTIPGAFIEFWQRGVNVTSCVQNATSGCKAALYVGYPITVKAYAAGYLPNARIETVYRGEPKRVLLPLIRIPSNGVSVEGPRVKNVNGEEVSFYPSGAPYTFEFTVAAAPGVERVGLYVRVGKESSANDGFAALYGFNRGDLKASLAEVVGSPLYYSYACNESVLSPHPANQDYFMNYQKWVEVRLTGSGPYVVAFKVQGFPWLKADKLNVYYRAWARSTGFNGTAFYNRSPMDEELGLNWTSPTKNYCLARTNESVLNWNCGILGGFACTGDPVCQEKLQARGGSCLNPEVCGPSKALCTGRTQCCRFGDSLLCQSDCRTPVTCTPACALGEYCDASSGAGTCKDCDPAAVNQSFCAADCGGENKLCCDVALGAAGAGCNSGLLCGGWRKSESCSSQGVSIGIGPGNKAEASCQSLTLAVSPTSGRGSVRFSTAQQCSGLTFQVFKDNNLLPSSCFTLAQGFFDYNGLPGGAQCAFELDAQNKTKETQLVLRYDCPNYQARFTDIRLTLVDESQRVRRVYEPVQVTSRGGVCIAQDKAWKYRRSITVENPADEPLEGYPVLLEFDSSQMVRDGKVNADGSDLRIVTEGGLELPYYLDANTMGSERTRLWLPVDAASRFTRSDFYLYYGNPRANTPPQPYDLPLSPGSTNNEWVFERFDGWARRCVGLVQCTPIDPPVGGAEVAVNKTCTLTDASVCGTLCPASCTLTSSTSPGPSCVVSGGGLGSVKTFTCTACPPCTPAPKTCTVTSAASCGTENASALTFYHEFKVPTGVVFLTHSGSVDLAKPQFYDWQLFSGNSSVWKYAGTGQEGYSNVRVDANVGDRLVYAFTVKRPMMGVPDAEVVNGRARTTALSLRIARPPTASLGAEQQPPKVG